MKSKILMLVASLLLILVYFVPLWMISIEAPQFPEGLGLWIYINDIKGFSETDLKSLNTLNHYIGMKEIEPDKILELKIMPYILGGFILLGIIFAFIEKPFLKYLWLILLLIAVIVGIYDYYLWGYEYGHNLDPKAIIKIEGMSYQPPLIGKKQLLNITVFSYPYFGSAIVAISAFLGFLSARSCKKKLVENA